MDITYHVTAMPKTIYFNREGDHDHNGLLYALTPNFPILKYIDALAKVGTPHPPEGDDTPERWQASALARATVLGISLPATPDEARQPHPLVRPLVLRCNLGDTVTVVLENQIQNHCVGLHLVCDGYDIQKDDGSQVGHNPPSLVKYGASRPYTLPCSHEGVFPFHDGGNYSGGEEDGTNVYGLFGALIVEPPGTTWRDPVTGRTSSDGPLDGLYLDILPPVVNIPDAKSSESLLDHEWEPPQEYSNLNEVAHREFVIFFQDEPHFKNHHHGAKDPCGHDHDTLPIMPVSYRAEPMINRERKIWALLQENPDYFGDRPVLNEEQHHSSWMFGDPATPILKAYIGDPVRIRFVHAAVKETHVFHLHMYEWHAVPSDPESPRIDAISVSPQTAHTIEPLWGAGNRHQVAGDVIWHCHLYPHFHEGMWGIFRTFETLQKVTREGDVVVRGPRVAFAPGEEAIYGHRYIGQYPDGTLIENLLPLPDRTPPPPPTPTHPGFPLYIPGTVAQKSPIPPWPDRELMAGEERFCEFDSLQAAHMPEDYNYRPIPYSLERNAFNQNPFPGELFTRNPLRRQQEKQWSGDNHFTANGDRELCYDVIMEKLRIDYNGYDWHDKDGHLYYLKRDGDITKREKEPLFFRALHGQILNLTFENRTPFGPTKPDIKQTAFDLAFPPCDKRVWEGECAMHVHMVKFDPICADGASTGWNYISGPVAKKKMVYRWWLDKEFGSIFFHDHLFANYRQKHGLFGALIVEPVGSQFFHPKRHEKIVSGLQARIKTTRSIIDKADLIDIPPTTWAREFCIGIADFIPMWKGDDPLNAPDKPGGHGDQGVMALNYRCEPIRERMEKKDPVKRVDPSKWFTSLEPYNRDPDTTLFLTYRDDPLWFRVIQGSHEEQHSFQVHGMRWQRFRGNNSRNSPIRNQQTFGISEAFTFVNHEAYTAGDYMYKLSAADDLWLGCWGLIRALPRTLSLDEAEGLLHLSDSGADAHATEEVPLPTPALDAADKDGYEDSQIPPGEKMRHFHVTVRRERIVYREGDLIDPCGLVYTIDSITGPDGAACPVHPIETREPLVLRCREGEWVRVTLRNAIPEDVILTPEPRAPKVPVEAMKGDTNIPDRPVSSKVSLHADLVKYDVRTSDGANIGRNPGRRNKGQAVDPSKGSYYYEWDTRRRPLTANEGEPLGPILLQDMADFRNHRHHGLIGALIIEHTDATPYFVAAGEATAGSDAPEAWHGTRVTVVRTSEDNRAEEAVLLMQDGLRLYLNGDTNSELPRDEPPSHGEDETDPEDQGQKGFNYRCEPVGPIFDPNYTPQPPHTWLANPNPATPIFKVPLHAKVRLHLLGAQDKPRNQSFTVHGVAWPEWRYLSADKQNFVSSESAITCGTARTFEFTPTFEGDYAYRSGVLKWAVPQGLWGIIRVVKV